MYSARALLDPGVDGVEERRDLRELLLRLSGGGQCLEIAFHALQPELCDVVRNGVVVACL